MKPLIALSLLLLLPACMTQVKDAKKQSVAVVTPGVDKAQCSFTNSRGEVAMLYETPGNVTLTRGGGNVTVLCKKTGYLDTIELLREVEENITYMDKAADTVGLVYDPFRQVYHKYPSQVVVLMEPDGRPVVGEWRGDKFIFRKNLKPSNRVENPNPAEQEKRLQAARELLRAQMLLHKEEIKGRKDEEHDKPKKEESVVIPSVPKITPKIAPTLEGATPLAR